MGRKLLQETKGNLRLLKKPEVTLTDEKNLIAGLILSDQVCRQLLPGIAPGIFDFPAVEMLISWIRDYFHKHKAAPGDKIHDLLEENSEKLKDEQVEWIEDFLDSLPDTCDDKACIEAASSFLTDLRTKRNVIVIQGGKIHEMVEHAEQIMLNNGLPIYQRGPMLVRISL